MSLITKLNDLPHKKFKLLHFISVVIWSVISFILPLLFNTIKICNASNNIFELASVNKLPLLGILTIVLLVIAGLLIAAKLKKSEVAVTEKIKNVLNVKNTDGTFKTGAVTIKSFIEFGLTGLLEIAVLVCTIVIACNMNGYITQMVTASVDTIEAITNTFREYINFVLSLIIHNVSFILVGQAINAFILYPMEEVDSLWKALAEKNAIEIKQHQLDNM